MQQNETYQQRLEEMLKFIAHIRKNSSPKQLEDFIQSLSDNHELIFNLMQALENIPMDAESKKFICFFISKALQQSDFGFFDLKCYLRLLLNWQLPQAAKEVLQSGFKLFIRSQRSIVKKAFRDCEQIILDLASQTGQGFYESTIILSSSQVLRIEVRFPQNVNAIVQTYLLMALCLLQNVQEEQCYFFDSLKSIHRLAFQQGNILKNADVLMSVMNFYGELDELVMTIDANFQAFGKNFLEAVLNLNNLSHQMQLIYQMHCIADQDGLFDFLRLEQLRPNSVIKLKLRTAEIHHMFLTRFIRYYQSSNLVSDLLDLIPSICQTIGSYLSSEASLSAQQLSFLSNCGLFLSDYVKANALSCQICVHVLAAYGVPLIERGINIAEQSVQTGQQLHNELDSCCDKEELGTILSTANILVVELLEKEEFCVQFFKNWFKYTMAVRFNSEIDESITECFSLLNPLSTKTMFLLLSIISYRNQECFQQICSVISSKLNLDFLSELTSSQLKYFYYFLQDSWSTIFSSDYSLCTPLIGFALSYGDEGDEQIEYFALYFIKSIFEEAFNPEWILALAKGLDRFLSEDGAKLKWTVMQQNFCQNLEDIEGGTVVQIVRLMKERANVELERMLQQKSKKRVVNYGEAREYLGSCRHISKKIHYLQDKPSLLEQLLQFCSLVELAGSVKLQKGLVMMVIDLLPLFLSSSPSICSLYSLVLQKILLTFMHNNYQGDTLIIAILKFMNVLSAKGTTCPAILNVIVNGFLFYDVGKIITLEELHKSLVVIEHLLILLQKWLIQFEEVDHNLLIFLEKIESVLQEEQNRRYAGQLSKRVLAQTEIVRFIISSKLNQKTNWSLLLKYAFFGCFKEYDAFLLTWLMSKRLTDQDRQVQCFMFEIGVGLLVSWIQKQSIRLKKQLKSYSLLSSTFEKSFDKPLDMIHRSLDASIFQHSLADQVWLLMEKCGVTNQRVFSEKFPLLAIQKFRFMQLCKRAAMMKQKRQVELFQSQLQKRAHQLRELYNNFLFSSQQSKSNASQDTGKEKEGKRAIKKIVGDKFTEHFDKIFVKDSQKRNFDRAFICEGEEQQTKFCPIEDPTPMKLYKSSNLINCQYKETQKNVADGELQRSPLKPQPKNDYSWSSLSQSIGHLCIFERVSQSSKVQD